MPARLVSFAMQDVAQYGTAHSISDQGLGALHAAGKTGTSDSQRDSWFAGFTGSHLAVAWVGRDDNQVTGLWSWSGGVAAWIALFKKLPSAPLDIPLDGIEMVTINPQSGERTDTQCAGARQFPFMAGFAPSGSDGCVMDKIRSIFGGN